MLHHFNRHTSSTWGQWKPKYTNILSDPTFETGTLVVPYTGATGGSEVSIVSDPNPCGNDNVLLYRTTLSSTYDYTSPQEGASGILGVVSPSSQWKCRITLKNYGTWGTGVNRRTMCTVFSLNSSGGRLGVHYFYFIGYPQGSSPPTEYTTYESNVVTLTSNASRIGLRLDLFNDATLSAPPSWGVYVASWELYPV